MADRVDRLLRSALARVAWESDILQVRSFRFWIDQALGRVFDALLGRRRRGPGIPVAKVVRLLAVPATLAHAPQALARPAREFAELAASPSSTASPTASPPARRPDPDVAGGQA